MKAALIAVALAAPALVGAQTFGKWMGASDDNQVAAGVPSDGGAFLGMSCPKTSPSCNWFVSLDIKCEPGLQTPILLSSNLGGLALTGTCAGITNDARLWRYFIEDASNGEAIGRAITSGGTVGIVAALKNGRFSVYRFDVDNWEPAMEALSEGHKRLRSAGSRDGVM